MGRGVDFLLLWQMHVEIGLGACSHGGEADKPP